MPSNACPIVWGSMTSETKGHVFILGSLIVFSLFNDFYIAKGLIPMENKKAGATNEWKKSVGY